jgi:hypothetical protein
MTAHIQLDLFEEYDEVMLLRKEIEIIDGRTRNVQRGLFSRYNTFCKEILSLLEEQKKEIDILRAMQLQRVK